MSESANDAQNLADTAILLIDCVRLEVNLNTRAAALFAPRAETDLRTDSRADMPLARVLQHLQTDEQAWLRDAVQTSAQHPPAKPLQRVVHVRDGEGRLREMELQLESAGQHAVGTLLVILRERSVSTAVTTDNHSSLSVLAGGIAHDFNNLLVGVMGNLDLARYSEHLSADTQHHLDAAQNAAERAAELCRQLLAYSGRTPVRTVVKDINEELRRVTPLLRRVVAQTPIAVRASHATATVQLVVEAAEGELRAPIDSGLLVQLLLNLVSNAAEACKQGGIVRVYTRAVRWPPAAGTIDMDADTGELRWINHVPAAGDYVQLEVVDNGTGMSESMQPRIFEPFFSSHGEGRGLGLPAAEGIVQQHGGSIALRSRLGHGTTVAVLIPAAHPSAPAHAPAQVQHQPRIGTVLIVDDEPAVRDVLRLQIERLGYRTAAVGNGQLAVDFVHGHGDAVRAVVLDQTMPVMGGTEAYRRLRDIAPRLPIIMTTGYSEETLLELIAHDEHAAFLAKPFAIGRLRELLEQLSA